MWITYLSIESYSLNAKNNLWINGVDNLSKMWIVFKKRQKQGYPQLIHTQFVDKF